MDAQAYAEMYSQMAGNFAIVVLVVVAIGWLVSCLFSKPSKSPKATEEKLPQSAAIQKESEPQIPLLSERESERLIALQEANRQSVQLNLLALDSLQQMTEIAALHRTDTTTRYSPQNDPWYQQAEWQ